MVEILLETFLNNLSLCHILYKVIHNFRGENFRPEFRQISELRSLIDVPVLALTATASKKVEKDIYSFLLFDDEETLSVQLIPDR